MPLALVQSLLEAGLPKVLVLAILLLGWNTERSGVQDVDCVEVFSGQMSVSMALCSAGLRTCSYDAAYSRAMNINSAAGFAPEPCQLNRRVLALLVLACSTKLLTGGQVDWYLDCLALLPNLANHDEKHEAAAATTATVVAKWAPICLPGASMLNVGLDKPRHVGSQPTLLAYPLRRSGAPGPAHE